MSRMIPFSIVLVTLVLPLWMGSRRKRPSLRTLFVSLVLIALVWAYLALSVYPKFVLPE